MNMTFSFNRCSLEVTGVKNFEPYKLTGRGKKKNTLKTRGFEFGPTHSEKVIKRVIMERDTYNMLNPECFGRFWECTSSRTSWIIRRWGYGPRSSDKKKLILAGKLTEKAQLCHPQTNKHSSTTLHSYPAPKKCEAL